MPDSDTFAPELDARRAAPDQHSMPLENARGRVLDTRIAPGTRTPVHTRVWPAVHHVFSWSAFVRRAAQGAVLSALACALPGIGSAQQNPDRVEIVSVQPRALTRGVPITVSVEIAYTLTSLDSGLVQVGFNDRAVKRFGMADSVLVLRGTGRVTVQAEIIPVDWGTRGTFQAFAALGPRRVGHSSWMPVARAPAVKLQVVP